jgi:TatA/E family protein of Tat protein translocase
MVTDILQPTHLLFILVVALLVLGPKRLPEVARTLGNGLRDFRSAISGETDERPGQSGHYITADEDEPDHASDAPAAATAPPPATSAAPPGTPEPAPPPTEEQTAPTERQPAPQHDSPGSPPA